MKYIIIIFSFLTVISTATSTNYWIQKNGYRELNWNTDPLAWLKISPDGKYLYTGTNNGKIIKIDIATGDTIKSWIKSYAIADINTEDETVFTINQDQYPKIIKKLRLDDDSIVYIVSANFNNKYGHNSGGGCGITSCGLKISNDNSTFVLLEQIYCQYGGSINAENTGQIEIHDMNTGDSLYIVNYWNTPIDAVFGNTRHIALTTNYYLKLYRPEFPAYSSFDNLISLDSNKNITLKGGIDTNENVRYMSFSKNDDILLGSASSKISIWDVATGNYLKSAIPPVYSDFNGQFYFLKWSGKSDVYLHSYSLINKTDTSVKKSIIMFYHKDFQVPVDSVVLDGINQNYYYCSGPDSTSFFTISQNNIIRWFNPDVIANNLKVYFNSDKNITLPGDTVKFTDISRGNPESWFWDFGDGFTSNDQDPYHIYTKSGSFSVKLIVTNGSIKDSLTKNQYILVNSNLKADFITDITTGDPPLTVNFTNKSTGDIKSYSWNYRDWSIDSVKNPTHIFVNPGIFSVTLIVSDGTYSDTLTKKYLIKVNRIPIQDAILNQEFVKELPYSNLRGTTVFDIEDGYFAEGFSSTQNTVMKIDKSLSSIISSKSLYTNSFHRPMQKAGNGLYYIIGDSISSPLLVMFNQCTKTLDDFKQFYGRKFETTAQLFDYTTDTSGVFLYNNSVPIPHINTWDDITNIKLDNFGKQNIGKI